MKNDGGSARYRWQADIEVEGVSNNSLFIARSKDSQLVDDGWCAAGERSLVDVDYGGVEYI